MISSANTRGLYDEDVEPRDDFRGVSKRIAESTIAQKKQKINNISAQR